MNIRTRKSVLMFIGLALVILAGCGSKNQDSLIGKNVNENAIVMDANDINANAAANDTESLVPQRGATPPPVEVSPSDHETTAEPVNVANQTENTMDQAEPDQDDTNQE